MSGYEVASLTGVESLPGPGSLRWTPLRRHFGITAFGINAYTATEVGQDVVEEHDEARLGHEELYLVLAGRATFVLDGDEVDVPAGSAVFLRDPNVRRYARAEEAGTTVLALGGKPGLHEVSAWEYFFAAYPKADEGDYDGRARRDRRRSGARGPSIRRSSTTGPASTRERDGSRRRARRSTARSSSIPSCEGGPTRTRIWRSYASPGSRRPAARRRSSGTGSASGRATTSTAPKPSPARAPTSSSSPSASAKPLCDCSPPNGTS